MVVGLWAVWKWGFSEWLRRHRDKPSLEGAIEVEPLRRKNGKVLVDVRAKWINRGTFPVYIDIKKTKVNVYLAEKPLIGDAFYPPKDIGKYLFHVRPFKGRESWFMLEPGTASHISAWCVIDTNKYYWFRWRLVRKPVWGETLAPYYETHILYKYSSSNNKIDPTG